MGFPFTIPQVKAFEAKNRTLAINIFEWAVKRTDSSGSPLPPLKHLKQCSAKKCQERCIVNILKYKDHYYGITNINRILNFDTNNYNRKWCERCVQPFYRKESLEKHRVVCYQDMGQVETMSSEEEKDFHFTNWKATMSPLFVAYADSECMLLPQGACANEASADAVASNTPPQNAVTDACANEASADAVATNTRVQQKLQKHTACAVGYIIVPHAAINRSTLPDNLNLQYKSFVGKDCVHQYLQSLEQDARDAYEWAKVYATQANGVCTRVEAAEAQHYPLHIVQTAI